MGQLALVFLDALRKQRAHSMESVLAAVGIPHPPSLTPDGRPNPAYKAIAYQLSLARKILLAERGAERFQVRLGAGKPMYVLPSTPRVAHVRTCATPPNDLHSGLIGNRLLSHAESNLSREHATAAFAMTAQDAGREATAAAH